MFTFQTKMAMLKAILTKNSPFYVQFYISNRCHLKCKMCNIVEANAEFEAFSHEKIESIAKNLVEIGVGVVLLTGGEPFLRSDIDEIVRIFKFYKLDIRLQTAGLTTRWGKIAHCAELGVMDINVSIDSLDERLSDYINGVEGSWRNAICTIAFISRVYQNRDGICALGCVLSRYNIEEVDAVLDFANEIGWWLSLVPIHITQVNQPLNFRGYDQYFSFEEKNYHTVDALINRLKKKKREGYNLFDSDDYLDSISHFIITGHPNWRKNNVCDSPNLYFAINPDASFAPCCDHRLDENIYIYHPDFPKIYRSKEFRAKVRKIVMQCPGCNFGSFPEMTLSARSLSTITERFYLQYKTKRQGIKPFSEEQLFDIIDNIRKKYSIYAQDRQFLLRENKKWPRNSQNISQKLWNDEL